MNIVTLIQKKQKTNQDYKIICTELLKQKSVSQFHNILDDQSFYTDNELPLTLYYQRNLIKQLKDQSLKILQIITFVKFQVGNHTEFLSNLIEYKFKKIPELNNQQLNQIQYIIGQIVVDFWWQYECYKNLVQESYPEFYPELTSAIREKYQDSSTYISLMWVCSKNQELRLIVNNSLFAIYDLNQLDAKVNEYIQSITKLNPFNYETILSYIQTKSILKQKFILIYFRILFFYISLLHFKSEINLNESEPFNNKIYQKWQKSRIELVEDLLLDNSSKFSENFQLSDLQDQFQSRCQTFESKLLQLQQLEIFEKTKTNESIETLLYNKQFNEFKKQVEEIPFFILSKQFQSQSSHQMYNFIIAQFENLQLTLSQLEPIFAGKSNGQNFEEILNQLLSYFNNSTTIYQKQAIVDYLFQKNQFLKIEHQSVKKALVVKFDNVTQLCQFCLSLRKVMSSQDLIKILQTYKIIDSESMNFAAQVLKSKEIKNLLMIALHIYLEGNQNEQYYQQLVDFIKILFNLFNTDYEQVLKFFSVCFLDLKYYQINQLILQNQESLNDENCFLETIEFIKIILDHQMSVELRKYMLQRLSLLLSYVEDFQFEFLCEQIEQNSNVLLRYLKFKYFTKIGKLDQAQIFSKYLKRNALKFYKNHCANLLETAEVEILTEADILQSKQKAQEYFPFIKNAKYQINQNSFQIIQNFFEQEKQTSYQIIQYFDNIYFNNKNDNLQIESLNQYTQNQLQFLQNHFQQKKQQINEKINIEKQSLKQQVEIAKQFSSELKSYLQNINNQDQSSNYYLIQYDLSLEEAEMVLFYIFDNLFIKNSKQDLNLISPEFRSKFFNKDTIFDEKENEIQIKRILQNCQSNFQIQCLNAFLNQLLIQNEICIQEIIEKQNQINQINLEQKFQSLEIQIIGCKQLCPFCNRKCDVDPIQNHVHKCQNGHQLRGMAGIIVDNQPSLFFCEELEDNFNVYETQTKTVQKWSEFKKKYKDWNFNVLNNQQLKQRKDLLLMLWDSYFGSQLCKLRNQQFSLKRALDLEEYRGKKFTRVVQTSKAFHYIFALDDSGSMAGQRFENSKKGAYECLRILSQNSEARATIIIFNSYARTVAVQEAIQPQSLLNKINFQGGGTSFESALECIYKNVSECINQFTKHIILFYTDGEAEFPNNSIQKFKSLKLEQRQIIDLHICCEGNAPDNLAKMYSAFDGQIGSTNLMQQISPENVGQAWQKQIEEVVYKSC